MGTSAYAATLEPPRATAVEVSTRNVNAAIRAYFRIAALWQLSADEARKLLGQPARSTFYKWKRGQPSAVPYDTVRRISYVLGIYKALQILFQVPQQADAWVRQPNEAFGGGSALGRMLGGDVTDLAVVRRYLDSVRGSGA